MFFGMRRPAASGAVLRRARASGATSARSRRPTSRRASSASRWAGRRRRWVRERGYLLAMACSSASPALGSRSSTTTAPRPPCCCAAVICRRSSAACCSRARAAGAAASARCCRCSGVYGQTPFVLSPNSHCQPCLACTRNCFDFQPQVPSRPTCTTRTTDGASRAGCSRAHCRASSSASSWSLGPPDAVDWETYGRLVLFVLGSVGGFFALETVLGHLRRAGHRAVGRGRAQPLLLVQLADPGGAALSRSVRGG